MRPQKIKTKKLRLRKGIAIICLLFFPVTSFALDTLKLSLQEVENLFIKNSLFLLASNYNIKIQEALVIQAKLWQNPVIAAELNTYNPERQQYFDIGPSGQKVFSIEQLILLGGKRKNSVALAKQDVILAQLEFEDLLRTLRFQLRKSFYSIYFNQLTLTQYDDQLELLENLIKAYEKQSLKQNIALKEVLRLKASFFKLNNDRLELISEILNNQSILKTLTQDTLTIKPIPKEDELNIYAKPMLDLENLKLVSIEKRPDLLFTKEYVKWNQINFSLQRSLKIPNVSVGGNYDQRGGAFNNQLNLTVSSEFPVFNRNQGNIRYSESKLKVAELDKARKTQEVINEVESIFERITSIEKDFKKIESAFNNEFKLLNEGMIKNFQRRNVGLIEFVDFFESYNESINEINKIKKTELFLMKS